MLNESSLGKGQRRIHTSSTPFSSLELLAKYHVFKLMSSYLRESST